MEDVEEMGADAEDPGKGGIKCTSVGNFLQVCGSGGYPIWVWDVGANPLNGLYTGGVPAQGGPLDYGKKPRKLPESGREYPPPPSPPWGK